MFENGSRLSMTATEEAHRFGHPAIDVEHVFLALLLSPTETGRQLRAAGIELDAARRAVQEEHRHRVSALGIHDTELAPRPVPATGAGEIDWNERTLVLFLHAGGDSQVLLRSLIDDPGGFVVAVLHRVGTDPSEVRAATGADPSARGGDPARSPHSREEVMLDAFVPAPLHAVWSLLDDPQRRPEWDTLVTHIEPAGPDRWLGRSTPIKGWPTSERARTCSITLTARVEPRLLEWEVALPHARNGKHDRLRIDLRDARGGTSVQLTLRDLSAHRAGRLRRFLARNELAGLAAGISRPFRA
jgi:hypothetical protein